MAHVFKFDGTVTPVKNLGWLLKHSGEASAIAVRSNGLNGNEASLIVTGDGWVFYSPFASVDVLRRWIHRPSLAGIPVTDDMSHATTLRDLRSAYGCNHLDVTRPTADRPTFQCHDCGVTL